MNKLQISHDYTRVFFFGLILKFVFQMVNKWKIHAFKNLNEKYDLIIVRIFMQIIMTYDHKIIQCSYTIKILQILAYMEKT